MKRKKTSKMKTNINKMFKITHNNIPGMDRLTIPLSNKYSLLGLSKGDTINLNKGGENKKKSSQKHRVPPITITNVSRPDIVKQLDSLKIVNYRVKNISMGINVFVDSPDDFKKFRKELTEKSTQFFTHDLPEEKHSRVVLKGLDNIDPEEVKRELTSLEVPPIEVKVQIPKQKRYTNHANFIVSYKKGDSNLKKVYTIKDLFHTIVRWEPYRNNSGGPTQCRRCLLPGHGTRHCTLPPHCSYCSGPHLSETCEAINEAYKKAKAEMQKNAKTNPATSTDNKGENADAEMTDSKDADASKTEQTRLDIALKDFPTKCYNCIQAKKENVDHIAFSPKCPTKLKFIGVQKKLSAKGSQKQQHKSFTFNSAAFPSLSPSKNGLAFRNHGGHNPQPGPSSFSRSSKQQSFSDQARKMSFPKNPCPSPNINVEHSNELFSFNEIMSLVDELLSKMSNCSTKMEQFKVITDLTLKYVYDQQR